jgi:hypothetical protein
MADLSACFVCGGDIPEGVYAMQISTTTTPAAPRQAGTNCRCPMPQLLQAGAQSGLGVTPM